MATIGEAVAYNLNQLVEREQRGRPGAPAQYQRSDFRATRTASGKYGRYVNLQTGEEVSRRQFQKLIGRPLPPRTRAQARARVAQQIARRGLRVTKFSGIVRQPSGRDRREQRDRTMHDATDVAGVDLAPMLALWEQGNIEAAGDGFNDAFMPAWWNGGTGLIDDVDELAFDVGEEEE
jgi:hypothetical protein